MKFVYLLYTTSILDYVSNIYKQYIIFFNFTLKKTQTSHLKIAMNNYC